MYDPTKGTAQGRGWTGDDGYNPSSRSSRSNPVRTRTGDTLTVVRANTTLSHIKALLKPVAFLFVGAGLAIGHHLFNNWADGRAVYVFFKPL